MKNNIFKMTILSLILAGLTACGSSGGGGSKSVPTDPTVQNPFKPVENPSIDSVPEKYQQQVRELKKTTLPDDFFKNDDDSIRTLKLNGFEIKLGQELNLADYANGLTSFSLTADGVNAESEIKIYQQPYSVVFGEYWKFDENWVPDDGLNPGTTMIFNIHGLLTAKNDLPTDITANYTGQAFLNDELGKLSYEVDFAGRKGHGQITGINHTGTVKLLEAGITTRDVFIDGNQISNATGIDGKATMAKHNGEYDYHLNFYGPKAEEIAGYVKGNDATKGEIGFAGQRQVTP